MNLKKLENQLHSLDKAQEKYVSFGTVIQGGVAFIVVLPVQLLVAAFVFNLKGGRL